MNSPTEIICTQACFISQEECRALIDLSKSIGFVDATIEGKWRAPREFFVSDGRHNSRAAIDDFELAWVLWQRVKRIIPEKLAGKSAIGLNERLRFYRYVTGERFAAHTDGYFLRSENERSLLTLILYLNEDFTGGETFFLNSKTVIAPQTGKALVFAHQLWHQGLPVKSGTKYILRTDVIYR